MLSLTLRRQIFVTMTWVLARDVFLSLHSGYSSEITDRRPAIVLETGPSVRGKLISRTQTIVLHAVDKGIIEPAVYQPGLKRSMMFSTSRIECS